jgi:hypothetical protein
MNELTPPRPDFGLQRLVFEACLLAIWADASMSSGERHYVGHLLQVLATDEGERQELERLTFGEVNRHRLFGEIDRLESEDKRYLFDQCLGLLKSDKRVGRMELRFLRQLRRVCGVGFWAYQRELFSAAREDRVVLALPWLLIPLVLAIAAGVIFLKIEKESGSELVESERAFEIIYTLARPDETPAPETLAPESLFEAVRHSVVMVQVFRGLEPWAGGAGSVIGGDEEGYAYVLTNRHVVDFDPQEATLRFEVEQESGARYWAELDFYSRHHDLALLAVRGLPTEARPLPLASRDLLQVGQRVYAVGSPSGLKNTFTEGVISALRDDYIQTDAPIHFGSSGGPLITQTGLLCGVITMSHQVKDFSFALYAEQVVEMLEERRAIKSENRNESSD